jgi:hypothetical protein
MIVLILCTFEQFNVNQKKKLSESLFETKHMYMLNDMLKYMHTKYKQTFLYCTFKNNNMYAMYFRVDICTFLKCTQIPNNI